jgi:hypothetical protein
LGALPVRVFFLDPGALVGRYSPALLIFKLSFG